MVIPHYHSESGSYNNHIQEKKKGGTKKGKKEKNPKSKSKSKSVIQRYPNSYSALPPNNQRNRATRSLNSA